METMETRSDALKNSSLASGSLHTRTNSEEKNFPCDICQKIYFRTNDLSVHMRIHNGERPFRCDTCQKSFFRLHHLKAHKTIHTGKKPFKCETCQKSFRRSYNLVVHTATHTGKKAYQCDICKKSFIFLYKLNRHIRTHGKKMDTYPCPICQKLFSSRNCLSNHSRFCTGENPLQCNICQKSFSCRSNLNVHRKIHAGENQLPTEREDGLNRTSEESDSSMQRNGGLRRRRVSSVKGKTGSRREDLPPVQVYAKRCRADERSSVLFDFFMAKFFGCGFCDQMFRDDDEFMDHCTKHLSSSTSGTVFSVV